MKITNKLYLLSISLFLSACVTSNVPYVVSMNLTPEQIAEAPEELLCFDYEDFEIPEVNEAVKNRKINCNKVLKKSYKKIAEKQSSQGVCYDYIYSENPLQRDAAIYEAEKRKLDCPAIISLLVEQQRLEELEAIRIQQSINTMNIQNSINNPKRTICSGNVCHTY